MLPKLIAAVAAAAPLLVSFPVHAQAGSTKLAMLDPPVTSSHTRVDNGMLRVAGKMAGTKVWPVIHGPAFYPTWNDNNALRDGKSKPLDGEPLDSDRFHFR
ncbi:hypothetical protein FAZ95_29965 [Trinickia violacea]|uniref:Uncharacterized protein n=1 Tax=Trinickia violacea TaxID=2571746 RepID=A0A4P8IXP3_9BURK|nr:hypothetical protein [Trinickia violacea]QCP53291.1 hypothetical protein FAZ95_29965 [Trinickia violacea]